MTIEKGNDMAPQILRSINRPSTTSTHDQAPVPMPEALNPEPLEVRAARAILANDEEGCPALPYETWQLFAAMDDAAAGHDPSTSPRVRFCDTVRMETDADTDPGTVLSLLDLSIREVLAFSASVERDGDPAAIRYNILFRHSLHRMACQELALLMREWDRLTRPSGLLASSHQEGAAQADRPTERSSSHVAAARAILAGRPVPEGNPWCFDDCPKRFQGRVEEMMDMDPAPLPLSAAELYPDPDPETEGTESSVEQAVCQVLITLDTGLDESNMSDLSSVFLHELRQAQRRTLERLVAIWDQGKGGRQ